MGLIRKYSFGFCLTVMFVAIMLMIVLEVLKETTGFLAFNVTDSIPEKVVWISFDKEDLEKDDLVAFSPKVFGLNNIIALKKISGTPGDQIKIQVKTNTNELLINNRTIGSILPAQIDGKPLHPIEEKTIPKGFYFVSTDHALSFDSRYEEIGLINKDDIIGKAYAIF